MPWNMNDYPNAFKNFDPLLRKKAIDIANALLDNDYPEDKAIPIAISQAKEWMEDASDKEKKDYKKEANPSKNDRHDSTHSNPDLLDKDVEVLFEDESWVVKTKGAKRPSETFDKKADAVKRAKEIAENKDSSVIRYTKEGKRRQKTKGLKNELKRGWEKSQFLNKENPQLFQT